MAAVRTSGLSAAFEVEAHLRNVASKHCLRCSAQTGHFEYSRAAGSGHRE